MPDQYDAFGDIINKSDGIFGGTESNIAGQDGGLKAHDTPRTQATASGVAVEMQCRGCPRPLRLTVDYPELVAVKYNVAPQDVFAAYPQFVHGILTKWTYSSREQAWWPETRCSGCQNIAGPMFTPEEAEFHLRKARQMGWIDPQGEEFVSKLAYGMAQQGRAMQR